MSDAKGEEEAYCIFFERKPTAHKIYLSKPS
jgi:hypothetical protein